MEGSSIRFWYNVMDVDEDGFLTIEDVLTLLHEKKGWNDRAKYLQAFEVCWLELCDRCGVDTTSFVLLKDIEKSHSGSYCFRPFVMMEDAL